jgi:hypothetical protein
VFVHFADALWMSIAAEHVISAHSRGRGEMVDARDLKSLGSNFPCRFKSGRPHQEIGDFREFCLHSTKAIASATSAWCQLFFLRMFAHEQPVSRGDIGLHAFGNFVCIVCGWESACHIPLE